MRKALWVAVLCFSSITSGDARRDEQRKRGESDLAEAVKNMQEKCGDSIDVTYDTSADPDKPCNALYCGWGQCKDVAVALMQACEKPELKAIILEKIKSASCKYSEGSSKRTAAHNNGPEVGVNKQGVLRMQFDWETNDTFSGVSEYLKLWTASVYLEGPRCKKVRDPVAKLGPEEAEEAAKKLKKPKGMSAGDWQVCHPLQLRLLG